MRSIPISPKKHVTLLLVMILTTAAFASGQAQNASAIDPLPSWNEGATKKSILDFVARTTTPGSAEFVAPEDRIATFDNDGTLWVEQPIYTQFIFAMDRIKAMAPQHPEWKTEQPFEAVLENDQKTLLASGE